MKALAIYPDKRVEEIEILPDTSLEQKQEVVQGWIEPVDLRKRSGEYAGTMWVNEEGRYCFGPDDFNSIATDVAGLCGRFDLLATGVLGPVIIVGPARFETDGSDTDITDWLREQVSRVAKEAS